MARRMPGRRGQASKTSSARIRTTPGTTVPATSSHPTRPGPSKVVATPMESPLGQAEVTRGRVTGYTVDSTGLVVKLDCSAISRIAFSVAADAPHFRAAVSMTMMALNNRVNPATQEGHAFDQQYLWVKFAPTLGRRTIAGDPPDIRPAVAVGLSNSNEADPFDIAGFVVSPAG